MSTKEALGTDLDLTVLEHLDFEVPCTSEFCEKKQRGSHAAMYLVLFDCACSAFWCAERFAEYSIDHLPRLGGMTCFHHAKPRRFVKVVSSQYLKG